VIIDMQPSAGDRHARLFALAELFRDGLDGLQLRTQLCSAAIAYERDDSKRLKKNASPGSGALRRQTRGCPALERREKGKLVRLDVSIFVAPSRLRF